MNTKIVVDSSASLYTLQGVDFECVPLKIITDDAEYLDNGTMDALGMAQTLRLDFLPQRQRLAGRLRGS